MKNLFIFFRTQEFKKIEVEGMKLSTTQQKLQNHLEEFLKREDKLFMFIQPLKKHFGLSYCLCSFLINLAKKVPGDFEQIVYVVDTKYESDTIFKYFCSIGKEDHDGRSDGYHKLIVGNLTYHFDYIDSPRLRVLNEKTLLFLNLMYSTISI